MADLRGLEAGEAAELEALVARIGDPSQGLPDEVFRFALALVPMVNVDLFVVDGRERVLLAWREDEFADGWHVPGGIVRGRERLEDRIAAVARLELEAPVVAAPSPCAIWQLFGDRGHFISLVHRCTLNAPPRRRVVSVGDRPAPGDLGWFHSPPPCLYPSHRVYEADWDLLKDGPPSAPPIRTLHFSERDCVRCRTS